ncbi:glycosyltransferase [Aurantibacter aestuarii]|uniref:Group 1 glycosyl transferase n=1 Tax=Aurantibacter aestuarii TaxID=1266046 RepID=A0A2T1N9V4_9FLAO|nr:glycosyltransferase [Aurantibacter aestuarii]PSG88656.1 group 1 glycosyl transferase [Aurantibacter aestuarii]
MLYKKIKTYFKNLKLKKKLIKQEAFFKLEDYTFKSHNVLIVDEIIPEYNKDSGSRRLTEIIKLLIKNDVGVFLLADLKQYKYHSTYINYFKSLGVNVYEPKVEANKLVTKELFIKKIAFKLNTAWLHRPNIFYTYHDLIKTCNPNTKLVFDMVDFHYVRFMREFELSKNKYSKSEANKFLKIELDNCKKADAIIAISNTDKVLLEKHFEQKEKVLVLSNIHNYISENKYFKPFEKRRDLLFIGGFKHEPNIDAVKFLFEEIMPLVWKSHPDIKINIVGSTITNQIKSYQSPNFNIMGFVDDIDTIINSSRVFVAPLRFGAGIKGKIGQSLEHGLPLATTDVGEEGFEFGSVRSKMVANNAKDFAQLILNLYENKQSWEEVSSKCEDILKPFSLIETEKTLLQIINS